jgi:hypothetical protein
VRAVKASGPCRPFRHRPSYPRGSCRSTRTPPEISHRGAPLETRLGQDPMDVILDRGRGCLSDARLQKQERARNRRVDQRVAGATTTHARIRRSRRASGTGLRGQPGVPPVSRGPDEAMETKSCLGPLGHVGSPMVDGRAFRNNGTDTSTHWFRSRTMTRVAIATQAGGFASRTPIGRRSRVTPANRS